jgi:hypothetical protein
VKGSVIEEITQFDIDGEEGIAVWLEDGRFLWIASIEDRVLICETPKYRAN